MDKLNYDSIVEKFNVLSTDIVNICKHATQKDSKYDTFFHVQTAYFLSKIVSVLNMKVDSVSTGIIPINSYVINLAPSGFGKNLTTNIIDREILGKFRQKFMHDLLPMIQELNLEKIALKRQTNSSKSFDEILAEVKNESKGTGRYLYNFDEASQPAIKQMRTNILLNGCGALNLEIDEIGMNITRSFDALAVYLELYDVGQIKPKLIKNTKENVRDEDFVGGTPANLLAFGTPINLLNGSDEENKFINLLEIGYARRTLVGYIDGSNLSEEIDSNYDPIKHYQELLTTQNTTAHKSSLETFFEQLAVASNINKVLKLTPEAEVKLLHYRNYCKIEVSKLPNFQEIQKAEMQHRYFKALKLAGAYAAVKMKDEVTLEELDEAIYLVELSGIAFRKMLNRDKPHVKLAKFIADNPTPVTSSDLVDTLTFYKKAPVATKRELMALARAWGYRNNIIIKQTEHEGIEFFEGESLNKTDLSKLIISHTSDPIGTSGYKNVFAPWKTLEKLVTKSDSYFTNHHLIDGYRSDDKVAQGFNIIVVDVDKSNIPHLTASKMLEDFIHMVYTTKSNGVDGTYSYRILIPTNFILNFETEDFKDFMEKIYEWLPFGNIDTAAKDRCRRWATTYGADVHYNNVDTLFDVVSFIPNTSKNIELTDSMIKLSDHTAVDRWFILKAVKGNRNNALLRYALMLADTNLSYPEIVDKVYKLNDKLDIPLSKENIDASICVTLAKRLSLGKNKP